MDFQDLSEGAISLLTDGLTRLELDQMAKRSGKKLHNFANYLAAVIYNILRSFGLQRQGPLVIDAIFTAEQFAEVAAILGELATPLFGEAVVDVGTGIATGASNALENEVYYVYNELMKLPDKDQLAWAKKWTLGKKDKGAATDTRTSSSGDKNSSGRTGIESLLPGMRTIRMDIVRYLVDQTNGTELAKRYKILVPEMERRIAIQQWVNDSDEKSLFKVELARALASDNWREEASILIGMAEEDAAKKAKTPKPAEEHAASPFKAIGDALGFDVKNIKIADKAAVEAMRAATDQRVADWEKTARAERLYQREAAELLRGRNKIRIQWVAAVFMFIWRWIVARFRKQPKIVAGTTTEVIDAILVEPTAPSQEGRQLTSSNIERRP